MLGLWVGVAAADTGVLVAGGGLMGTKGVLVTSGVTGRRVGEGVGVTVGVTGVGVALGGGASRVMVVCAERPVVSWAKIVCTPAVDQAFLTRTSAVKVPSAFARKGSASLWD
jgi:hypothetical protein